MNKRNPTNTPDAFHVATTWKRSFTRRFNMAYTWCVYSEESTENRYWRLGEQYQMIQLSNILCITNMNLKKLLQVISTL